MHELQRDGDAVLESDKCYFDIFLSTISTVKRKTNTGKLINNFLIPSKK